MSERPTEFTAPLDPRYGSGCYRREIRLLMHGASRVEAALEDDAHAFAVSLTHDGSHVTDIEARAVRYPLTTCNGATLALRSVIGAPLSQSIIDLKKHADARSNCTHLFDLAALAMAHAFRGEKECIYRMEVSDAVEGRQQATLDRGAGRVMTWSLLHGSIVDPERFAGQKVLGGFTRWATVTLAGEELEFALMLQRAFFVAMSRMYDMSAASHGPASEDPMPSGVCFSYSPGVAEKAWRLKDSRRDFTDTPDALLRWHHP